MTQQEIKETLDKVQNLLDGLQGTDTSFLFVARDGNRFAMGGVPKYVGACITHAMLRYPIVRDIIHRCSAFYDTANKNFGETARKDKPDHLIEMYYKDTKDKGK